MLSCHMCEVEEEKGAPPSRGPRLFARNIRRLVGPPSWKRSDSVGAVPSSPLLSECKMPVRAPRERSCEGGCELTFSAIW